MIFHLIATCRVGQAQAECNCFKLWSWPLIAEYAYWAITQHFYAFTIMQFCCKCKEVKNDPITAKIIGKYVPTQTQIFRSEVYINVIFIWCIYYSISLDALYFSGVLKRHALQPGFTRYDIRHISGKQDWTISDMQSYSVNENTPPQVPDRKSGGHPRMILANLKF